MEAGHFAIGPSIGLKDAVVTDAIAPEADFIWYVAPGTEQRSRHNAVRGLGQLASNMVQV